MATDKFTPGAYVQIKLSRNNALREGNVIGLDPGGQRVHVNVFREAFQLCISEHYDKGEIVRVLGPPGTGPCQP